MSSLWYCDGARRAKAPEACADVGGKVRAVRRERVRLGFYLRDARDRVVTREERGLTLDEIESELLKREKKRLKHL